MFLDIGDANIKQESDVIPTVTKPRLRRTNLKATHHEARQRIDYKADFFNHYQHHWFSASLEVYHCLVHFLYVWKGLTF